MIGQSGGSTSRIRLISPLILASLAIIVGLVARVGLAGNRGLWADEFFSLAIATGHSLEHPAAVADPARGDFVELDRPAPAADYARYLDHQEKRVGPSTVINAVLLSDTSPPLYYLVLWVWTLIFGTADITLRLLSITWWAACLPPLGYLARRLGGPGAIAPTLFCFSATPSGVFYSTEGRMYSMLWFFAISTAALTLSLHRNGWTFSRLSLWALSSAAGFLTHYFFAFPWIAFVAWLMINPGRVRRLSVLGATFFIVLAIAPWYVHLSESLAGWRVTRDWLKWKPEGFSLLRSFARLAWSYFGPGTGRKRIALTLISLAVLAGAAIRSSGIRRLISPSLKLPWVWLLASLLGPVVFDSLRGTYTIDVPRYAISGLPAACLLFGVAMARLHPALQLAIATSLMLPWSLGVRDFYNRDRADEPYLRIGELLARETRPDDVVIIHSIPSGVIGLARYMEQAQATSAPVLVSWVGQLGRRQLENLPGLLAGRKRVRLVLIHNVGDPPSENRWLQEHATPVGVRRFETATISDFVPRQGERFPGTAASRAASAGTGH